MLSLLWAGPSIVWGQKVPLGSEFQVNTYTTGHQGFIHGPRVASDAAGNFVVVWASGEHDYSVIAAQRFDASGVPQGAEFEVGEIHYYKTPAVASDAAGNFVVVWQIDYSYCAGPTDYGICARRFDSTGAPLGAEFELAGHGAYPKVAADPAGNFMVVWSATGP
jgi:hypothetical protein